MSLPVVIPTPEANSVASLALKMEGMNPIEVVCEGDYDYANMLRERWNGEGFIIVEWDIAPWPGAIQQLQDCPNDLCVYEYVMHMTETGGRWGYSLGCIKFTPRFMQRYPLPTNLPETKWFEIDSLLWESWGHPTPCVHSPGVAHARR